MALKDDATLAIGSAHFYTAPVGTAYNAATGWTEIGHTSLEDILALNSEGGEVTTLGTLQKKQLRNTRTPYIDRFRVVIQQWDIDPLKLYFGSNGELLTGDNEDLFGVPVEALSTLAAWKMVAKDAGAEFCLYAPKADILRGDDPDFGSEDALANLPIDVQPLQYKENKWAWALTPLGTV